VSELRKGKPWPWSVFEGCEDVELVGEWDVSRTQKLRAFTFRRDGKSFVDIRCWSNYDIEEGYRDEFDIPLRRVLRMGVRKATMVHQALGEALEKVRETLGGLREQEGKVQTDAS